MSDMSELLDKVASYLPAEKAAFVQGALDYATRAHKCQRRRSGGPYIDHPVSAAMYLADLSLHAALTGHRVFSTLHTNDAPGAVPRLLDMGVEPYLAASSIEAVMGQRLARKLCPDCKEDYEPPVEDGLLISRELHIDTPQTLKLVTGCSRCRPTEYTDRIGRLGLLLVSGDIRQLILE